MLKNIAIPLMLAASEAEAQRAPTKDEVEEALEGDLRKVFKGLQADAAACTVEANTDIANLAQAVSDRKVELDAAELAVTNLEAADGAWGQADVARRQAVEAAIAQEVSENIANLLDDLDTKTADERAKAALWATAVNLFEEGVRTQTAADERNQAAIDKRALLETAQGHAEAAKQAAETQLALETNWRGYRYCELGNSVDGAAPGDAAKAWWQFVDVLTENTHDHDSDSNTAEVGNGTWSVDAVYSASTPERCQVPAITSRFDENGTALAADAADREVRPAVTYFLASGASPGLVAEAEDGTSMWTRQVVLTDATNALNATTTPAAMGGLARTKAGEVAWHTGNVIAATFTNQQRAREAAFYGSINAAKGGALSTANSMATDDTFMQPNPLVAPFLSNDADTDLMTAGAEGATKALGTALDARDHATTGAAKAMPSTRTQSSTAGEEWKWTWAALTTAQLETWKGNNSSAGASYNWFAAAKDVTAAVNDWWTAYGNGGTDVDDTQEEVGGAGTNQACTVSGWQVVNDADLSAETVAGCKASCVALKTGLFNASVDTSGPPVDNGGTSAPKYRDAGVDSTTLAAAVTTWCGAYSYNAGAGANLKCHLKLNGDAATGDGTNAGGCFKMTNIVLLGAAQAALVSAMTTLETPSGTQFALHTAMQGQADTQAGLEKAWLQAWYVQQYWANLKIQLTNTANGVVNAEVADVDYGAKSNDLAVRIAALGDANTGVNTTTAGATAKLTTAQGDLTTAQGLLADLQATVAAAQAVVTALGVRILRADDQIAELNTLITDTLTAQVDTRTADTTAFVDGEVADALAAKNAADAQVAEESSEGQGDAGELRANVATALSNYSDAQGLAEQAENNLTAALSNVVLADLRATVASDTETWTAQNNILNGLIADAEAAEQAHKEAEDAKDDAVLACQIAAYDTYRTALEGEMVQRAADLKTIKALVEGLETAAPGTEGARCEKALSNGTGRPQRGDMTCGGEESGLCCGAARVWMGSGEEADAGWRTIETCQSIEAQTYDYQPARAPMATTMPATISVPFTCIEGAKKLAAAASAAAAAVYMLA